MKRRIIAWLVLNLLRLLVGKNQSSLNRIRYEILRGF